MLISGGPKNQVYAYIHTVVKVDTEETRVVDFDDAARRRPKDYVAINAFLVVWSPASCTPLSYVSEFSI